MTIPRVWVDFMKTDSEHRLLLTTRGTIEDLKKLGIEPQEGLRLQVYSDDAGDQGNRDDLLADGIVHRDEEHDRWVLEIDWDAIKHTSDG